MSVFRSTLAHLYEFYFVKDSYGLSVPVFATTIGTHLMILVINVNSIYGLSVHLLSCTFMELLKRDLCYFDQKLIWRNNWKDLMV